MIQSKILNLCIGKKKNIKAKKLNSLTNYEKSSVLIEKKRCQFKLRFFH